MDTVRLFIKLFLTLKADREAKDELEFHEPYIDCIKLLSVERVDGNVNFDPRKEKLTNSAHVSMFNIYIHRPRV